MAVSGPNFMFGDSCYFVFLPKVFIPPTLMLTEMGLRLVMSDDFACAFGEYRHVALADSTIKFVFIVCWVKRAGDEDPCPLKNAGFITFPGLLIILHLLQGGLRPVGAVIGEALKVDKGA